MWAVNHPFKSNLYIIYFFFVRSFLSDTHSYVRTVHTHNLSTWFLVASILHTKHNTSTLPPHILQLIPHIINNYYYYSLFTLLTQYMYIKAIGYAPLPTTFIDNKCILFKEAATTTPFFHLLSFLTRNDVQENAIKMNYSNKLWPCINFFFFFWSIELIVAACVNIYAL